MNKTFIFLTCLLYLTLSQNCQAQTQTSCESLSCNWFNGTCTGTAKCQDGFQYLSNSSACVNCATLSENNCSLICTQYYFSTDNSSCMLCTNLDPFCSTCNSSACISCTTGFSPDPNFPAECLINACKIQYCRSCLTNTTCSICKTGYTPNINGTFCSLSSCSIASCLFCVSNSTCVTCQSGFQLSTDSSKCTLICRDPNCISCSSYTSCTTCANGYNYNVAGGFCKLLCSVANCNNCDLSTTCTECASGYSVSSSSTSCIVICNDTNCKTCTTPTLCTQCNPGYYLNNSICIKAICYISRCSNCSTTTQCAQCDSISTLSPNNQLCVQNCLAKIRNCFSCQTNDTCSACNPGFQLNSDATACNTICTIANCTACMTSSTCSNCASGYIVASDSLSCLFNCGILNCAFCNSTTTCQTCNGIYTLMDSATTCKLLCSPGFFVNSTTLSCQSCSLSVNFCLTCSFVNTTSSVICSKCADLYYLTANGLCGLCSNAIPNCLMCLDSANCSSCNTTYSLFYSSTTNSYSCKIPYSCNVSNCKLCLSDNSSKCSECNSAYYLTSNGSCALIECLDTQYYDTLTSSCLCPFGTYLRNKKCHYCNIDKCISCNSAGCIQCKSRHFPDDGQCKSCTSKCNNCTSSTSCLECDFGYTLRNGACVSSSTGGSTVVNSTGNTTTVVSCPPGCSKCSYFQGSVFCTKAKDGYAIDDSGNLIKCDDSCATCASLNYLICTSCYGSNTLVSGACLKCNDDYAVSCPSNNDFSTKCQSGYVNNKGICQSCAANCLTCGAAGAGKCDDGGCSNGFVKIVGTLNCTKCFSSCASCSANNPSTCLSCGTTSFLTNTSTCTACTSPCYSCTSATVCTGCLYNFNLDSNWCYARIGYPCSSQSKDTCTDCYTGFDLIGGACVADNSCNGTRTCKTCDKYYYLKSRQCLPCSTSSSTCDYCDSKNPSNCLVCTTGYYLRSSTKACLLCSSSMKGCDECSSSKFCTVAIGGYYIELDIWGDGTGKVKQCSSQCSTCSDSLSCDTCANGYKRVGTTCIYSKNVQSKLTLNPGKGSKDWWNDQNSDQTNLANAFININQLINSILAAIGITDSKRIIVNGLTFGSLILDTTVASSPDQNFAAFSSNFAASTANLPDFQVKSQSIIVNGDTGSSSSVNSAIILGITIPLVVLRTFVIYLVAVIIIFLKIKLSEGEDKDTSETQKEIQDQFQM